MFNENNILNTIFSEGKEYYKITTVHRGRVDLVKVDPTDFNRVVGTGYDNLVSVEKVINSLNNNNWKCVVSPNFNILIFN